MMLKEKSNPWARLKYLYVLPLAAIAVTAFCPVPEISEKADEISIMNKFSGNGGFAEKNAAKTSRVYSKLKGTVPEVIDASGLLNITDNELTDYVAVIMLFYHCAQPCFFMKKARTSLHCLEQLQGAEGSLWRQSHL